MDALIAGAVRTLDSSGATYSLVRVPGTFELPVAAQRIATNGAHVDGIVTLGTVIRGGTPHFEYVCQAAALGLTNVSTSTGVPVGFGVLTCDDVEQAAARASTDPHGDNKGVEAAHAVLETIVALRAFTS